jgi:hypothetical protein
MVDYSNGTNAKQGGLKFRYILILLLIAFVGGAVLDGWAVNHYSLFGYGKRQPAVVPVASQNVPVVSSSAPAPAIAPIDGSTQQVSALEGRMSQINADATAASGNATRAEGMLIAFAARRALDSGAALGYIEDQLKLRFGGSQPQAVATIISASAQPVTLSSLQGELGTLGSSLTTKNGGGVWETVQREFGELFVLRKEGTPSPAPTQKLKRAKAAADAGNIAGAIAEVQAMPGAALAKDWLIKARNYVAARKALDSIERAAIMVPVAPLAPALTQPAPTPVAPEAAPDPGAPASPTDKASSVFDQ